MAPNFETDNVNLLHRKGFEKARRIVQKGRFDEGDIEVCEGLIAQAKGGHYAEDASDQQLRIWYAEMVKQVNNHGAQAGFLIVKRKGFGLTKAEGWWVIQASDRMLVRFLLGEYIDYLHAIGWEAEGYVGVPE